MKSARQFVEEYLGKEAHFWQVTAKWLPGMDWKQAGTARVLEASESDDEAIAIVSGPAEGYDMRYLLECEAKGWVIAEVQRECGVCHFTGRNKDCQFCHGEGWCKP